MAERIVQLLQDVIARDGPVPLDLYLDAIVAALSFAGPPLQPITDYSEDYQQVLVKSSTGRAMFSAESWVTSPWTCVRIDVPSVPMGRPRAVTREGRPPAMRLDTASATFQRRLSSALRALDLPKPPGRCVVHTAASGSATVVAWRDLVTDYDGDPPSLPGDIDNYSKNVLDGLQRGALLANDRAVIRLSGVKASPADIGAVPTLEERLLAAIHTACPHAETAPITELEDVRNTVGATRAQMHTWFPSFPARPARPQRARKQTARVRVATASKADLEAKRTHLYAIADADPDATTAHLARTAGIGRQTATKWLKQRQMQDATGQEGPGQEAADPPTSAAAGAAGNSSSPGTTSSSGNPTSTSTPGRARRKNKRDLAREANASARQAAVDQLKAKQTRVLELAKQEPKLSTTTIAKQARVSRVTATKWIKESRA